MDVDLEKFFDRVNHDMLMARVAEKGKGQASPKTHPCGMPTDGRRNAARRTAKSIPG